MATIQKTYINALLADATYALVGNVENISGKDLIDFLNDRMTPILAQYIADNFTVVTHIDSDDLTGSGFDATVWRSNDGKVYVSLTGTENVQDFLTDIDLAVTSGAARLQIAELVNWWLKITTSEMAPQIAVVPVIDNSIQPQIIYEFGSAPSVQGQGLLTGVTNVEVNGHSLGGHLASAFARLFGTSAGSTGEGKVAIDYVTTFNSAGFNGNSNFVFQEIERLIGTGLGRLPSPLEQANGFAEHGINVTTNSFFSSQVGQRVEIFNEESTGIPNHYMYKLTDALALGDVFARIDNTFDITRMNTLFECGSNKADASLESILDALVHLFIDNSISNTPIGDEGDSLNSRVIYHFNLAALKDELFEDATLLNPQLKPNYQNLRIVDVASLAGSASLNTAEGLAYRYALTELNPFAVVGADYSIHNAAGELNVYDAVNGQGQLTAQWLADCAQMLANILLRNIADSIMVVGDGHNETYQDMATGQLFSTADIGYIGPDLPPDSKHILFGDDLANQLQGGNKNDHLYGGGGSDLLTGGKGNDYMEGGSGSDLYAFIAGDGMDTILDTDGLGKITLDGVQIKGQTDVAANQWIQAGQTWQDRQHHIGYNLVTQADGTQDLLIATADNTLIVKNWHADELGIRLDSVTPPEPEIILTVTGDFNPLDQDPNSDGIQLGYDALGNLVTDPNQPDPDHEDSLYDSTDNDKLQGFGGDDILDAIRGGDDLLEGGAGSNILNGGSGNDFLYADVETSVADALAQADTQAATGQRGDWLYGGDDDDTLLGEGGNDMLLGGSGADMLIGGGGDDNLFGDKTGNANLDWDVFRSTITSNNDTTYTLTYFRSTAYDNPVGGDDILYGGAGNDWLIGNRGNDILNGGVGNDVLFGGEDKDFLLGGDGNDELYGNAGVSSPLEDGDDYLDGGTGNDKLVGGGGNDNLFGGLGDDVLYGDHNGTLEADEGEDYLDGSDGSDTLFGGGKNDILLGGAGMDYLFGEAGDDIMRGGADDDQLSGGAGMDYLDGGDGNDIIDGGEGNDTLLGGAGADILQGGAGDDVYLDVTSEDTINDILGHSVIHLSQASGLATDNALSKVDQNGVDLAITLDNGETITLSNALYMDATLVFAGGSEMDLETLVGNQLTGAVSLQLGNNGGKLYGGAGADSLYGGSGNDTLSGALGADKLYGQAGNDLLNGGDGNDILDGGEGDDTLIGGAGRDLLLGGSGNDSYQLTSAADGYKIADTQGQNLIKFGSDIDPNHLTASISTLAGQTALTLTLAGVELATITQGYSSFGFEFADGTRLTADDFILSYQTGNGNGNIVGTDNDDTLLGGQTSDSLYGFAGNDILWGGRGDDVMYGGLGSDDYRYRLGDGRDTIVETDDTNLSAQDRVNFGAGITSSDEVFNRCLNGDLAVTVAGLTDAITITGWYNDAATRVESFVFAGGETVTADTLLGLAIMPQTGSAGNDTLTGSGYRDIIMAGTGDDLLTGNGGDDDLYGEAGTDTYRFTLGSGADQIFEVAGETSMIDIGGFDLGCRKTPKSHTIQLSGKWIP